MAGTHHPRASVDPPTTWKQGPPKARQARRYGPARRTIEPARIVVPAVSGGKNWQAAVAPGESGLFGLAAPVPILQMAYVHLFLLLARFSLIEIF